MLGFIIGELLALNNAKRLGNKLAANRPGWFHLSQRRTGEHYWIGPFPARDAVESWAAANPMPPDVVASIEYCINRADAVRRASGLLAAAGSSSQKRAGGALRCFKCGSELSPVTKFCGECGVNVTLVTGAK